jgi:hypothetical protein
LLKIPAIVCNATFNTTCTCLCFNEFPEQRFELVAKLQLPGDLQNAADFQFREEFLLLQLKFDFSLVAKIAYCCVMFTIQRFVHWEEFFEETFHRRFAVLALNGHGLRHRAKLYRFYPGGERHL